MSPKKSDIFNSVYKPKLKKSAKEIYDTVPPAVVRRMPRYFRYLRDLLNNDILRVSSGELAHLMGTTSSQIRQDFNCFGDFGQQGYGYNVKFLYTQISRILGVNKKYPAVIIGSGELCTALLNTTGFDIRGVCVVGVFDINEENTGKKNGAYTVQHISRLKEFCQKEPVSLAVVASLDADASVCDVIKEAGIKGIWNFSGKEFSPEGIKCRNVMFGDSLMLLMYDIGVSDEDM